MLQDFWPAKKICSCFIQEWKIAGKKLLRSQVTTMAENNILKFPIPTLIFDGIKSEKKMLQDFWPPL